jgi:uncharacterized tellurite resistance protein B-like protein
MLEVIKRMLTGTSPAQDGTRAGATSPAGTAPGAGEGGERLRLAACVLLLELAHADGHFSSEERLHIQEAMALHFDLPADGARQLMELADASRRESVELHQFTSRLTSAYDEGQRLLLAEIMWRIVEADGQLSEHEDYLKRKLGRLLDLRPGYLAEARKRAAPPREP